MIFTPWRMIVNDALYRYLYIHTTYIVYLIYC